MIGNFLSRFLFAFVNPRSGITWARPGQITVVFFASILEKIRHLSGKSTGLGTIGRINILLADDDEDDRQLFAEAVAKIDPVISIDAANNGMELLAKMETGTRPELIFLDLNMPGKTGKECLVEIRKHPEWKDIPVIIYSTSANNKDIQETYFSGANLYMLKPTSFRELIQIIRKAFSFDWDQTPRVPQHDFVLKQPGKYD